MKKKRKDTPAKPAETGAAEVRGPLGVMLVEPLPVVNEGLALFIDSQDDMELVGQAYTADEALAIFGRLPRSAGRMVLVALETSGEHDAFWLIRQLREAHPTAVVVASSASSAKASVSRALFAGADGYINKRSHPAEFLDGIRRSAQGELVLTGLPTDWFGDIAEGVASERDTTPMLTERERQILTVAAEGISAKAIAQRLGLAERTVTTHLTNIYGKLGVHGRVEAITAAARSGLVSIDLEGLNASEGP
jgi:DNA-binding NarL/FixJ family response regulator